MIYRHQFEARILPPLAQI